ncbi:hypothetical protein C7S16_2830 [Burkholderia thailandensis]|uniref:Uncharacterized protein n=1 Tax=Burkholderia thailandensis TaxID=57975 RepID=A0AAW9CUG2_BURTH|nr:hypothetical protein [Burkholderia thailandensis]
MLETFPFSRGSPRAGRPSPEEARAIRRFGRPGAMWRRLRGWFARGGCHGGCRSPGFSRRVARSRDDARAASATFAFGRAHARAAV